jgi:hypothetical protein
VRGERAQSEEARPVEVRVDVAQHALGGRLVVALAPRQRFERDAGDERVALGRARQQPVRRRVRAE